MRAPRLESFIAPIATAGFAALRLPGAPADGWYLTWLGSDGETHRTDLLTERSETRSCRPNPPVTASAVRFLGVFHDDYFPPNSAT
jgi:hypothetical protein